MANVPREVGDYRWCRVEGRGRREKTGGDYDGNDEVEDKRCTGLMLISGDGDDCDVGGGGCGW